MNQQEKQKLNQVVHHSSHGSIGLQALLMAAGTMTSRVLGLLREMLFSALFPRIVTDAWYAAFRLPNIIRRLLGEGSLSVSFIPVFVEAKMDSEERARNLVNAFYTVFLIVISALTAFGIVAAEQILPYLLSDTYLADPEKYQMVLMMSQIMFGYVFLVCTYAYFMAILNSLGKFGLAAMAPTFFNIVIVISTLIPQKFLAWPGQAISWGVILGGIVQAGILIPALRRLGYLPKFSLAIWKNKDVLRVLRSMLPGLAGMAVLQITTLLNMNFASSLGDGPITYLSLADRLMELPLSLVSVSIGTALLPTLSRLWSENQPENMIRTTDRFFRLNLFICLPAALGLFFLAQPIVEMLFERGQFQARETLIVADVIRIYSVIMIFTSIVRVFVPAFYAIKNTWLPASVSMICVVTHFFIAPLLMAEFGLRGLNLSSLISVLLNWVLLFVAFRWLIGRFPWGAMLKSMTLWIVPLASLAAWLQVYSPLRELIVVNALARGLLLGFVIVIGVVIFAGVSHWLRIEEYQSTSEVIFGKLRRRYPRYFR